MHHINLNGELIAEDQPVLKAGSRWLQLGDAVFETLRVFEGKMPFLSDHVNQLELSINQLEMEPKQYLTVSFLDREIRKVLEHNELTNAEVNIFAYREGSPTFSSNDNEAGFLITATPLDFSSYQWSEKGLKVGVFNKFHHPRHELAALNTTDRVITSSAARFAINQQLDDVLILNTEGRPIMFSGGGILIYLNNEILFPVYSEGAPPNILREYLLPMANRMNIDHRPAEITVEMVQEAEEVMVVDEITGIQYASEFEGKSYRCDLAQQLHRKISEFINSY